MDITNLPENIIIFHDSLKNKKINNYSVYKCNWYLSLI
jgi:hypothetical protein